MVLGAWTGTIPEWFAAIGTVGSLFLALYLMLSDRRNRERAQARNIHIWTEANNRGEFYKLRNLSNAPISDAQVFWRPWTRPEQIADCLRHPVRAVRRARRSKLIRPRDTPIYSWPFDFDGSGFIEAGDFQSIELPLNVRSRSDQKQFVMFTDAANRRWTIDDRDHRIIGSWWGFRREMRLKGKFGWEQEARRFGKSARRYRRELERAEARRTNEVENPPAAK